jgi:hypothetical protein
VRLTVELMKWLPLQENKKKMVPIGIQGREDRSVGFIGRNSGLFQTLPDYIRGRRGNQKIQSDGADQFQRDRITRN